MSRMKKVPYAASAALIVALAACSDDVSLPHGDAARVGEGPALSIGPGGSHCWEGSLDTQGSITIDANGMHFFASSHNLCWPGTVHVQADLYWGVVSDCSQAVPKMINGYGSPDPNQNFYENPATQYLSVSRTHPVPQGGLVKARMVRQHRFWHYGYGAYGGPFTDIVEETVSCQSPPSPPHVPFTALSMGGCNQQECNYQQTIWGCENFVLTATPTGSGPFTYRWQDWTTSNTHAFQVCPYPNGENTFRQFWVVVTDVPTGVTMSRMINWTFFNGTGSGGGCPECH